MLRTKSAHRTATRRQFVRGLSGLAAGLAMPFVAGRNVLGANARLNMAAIGLGGVGEDDIGFCSGENVVALCDVDQRAAAATFKRFPDAKRFTDFRRMLDLEGAHIDAVTVSTPDHSHFHVARAAIERGKHVYLQKPLTHDVWEARTLAGLARENKVVTQMGIQGHAHPDSRRLVELIRAGVLGDVHEMHIWTDRPIWPQGMQRPRPARVPTGLDWDLWLGPAPWRDYHVGCVPYKWRAFWDFGSGALGDMGCHLMDLAFFALELGAPSRIAATSSGVNTETAPKWSVVTYDFPGVRGGPPRKLVWYDGGRTPPAALAKQTKLSRKGYIFVGSKDVLYVPYYWGRGTLRSGARMDDHASVPQTLPRLPELDEDPHEAHVLEWLTACKGEGKTLADFDYAGPLTEAVLLGNVALRAGTAIEWNATELRITNIAAANAFIRREYRPGF
jgi:predicted dehydrogenase